MAPNSTAATSSTTTKSTSSALNFFSKYSRVASGSSATQVADFASTRRKLTCTHLSMSRLYGNYTCQNCQQPSPTGYVYACTQDHGTPFSIEPLHRIADPEQYLNLRLRNQPPGHHIGDESDDDSVDLERWNEKPSIFEIECEGQRMLTTELSPWLEKAIQRGEYTRDQVKRIRIQKEEVVTVAQAARVRFETEERERSSQLRPPPGLSPSKQAVAGKKQPEQQQREAGAEEAVDTNPHLPYPVISEVHQPANTPISEEDFPPTPSPSPAKGGQPKPLHPLPVSFSFGPKPTPPSAPATKAVSAYSPPTSSKSTGRKALYPYCTLLACPYCRPTYRERAYACIDHAYEHKSASNEPVLSLNSLEAEPWGPYLNSVSVMKTIGLTSPPPSSVSPGPKLRSWDSRDVVLGSLSEGDGHGVKLRHSVGDVGDLGVRAMDSESKRESKLGVRRSIKGKVRQFLQRREGTSSTNSSASSSVSGSSEDSEASSDGLSMLVGTGHGDEVGSEKRDFAAVVLEAGDRALRVEREKGLMPKENSESVAVNDLLGPRAEGNLVMGDFVMGDVEELDVTEGRARGIAVTEEAAEMQAPDIVLPA